MNSINYTNPLTKSDLSDDGQIIQLRKVSGMVKQTQPLSNLRFVFFSNIPLAFLNIPFLSQLEGVEGIMVA